MSCASIFPVCSACLLHILESPSVPRHLLVANFFSLYSSRVDRRQEPYDIGVGDSRRNLVVNSFGEFKF